MLWISAIAATSALFGYVLGGRRLATLVIASLVAVAAVPKVGPALTAGLVELIGWDTWVGVAVCWGAAYVGIVAAVTAVITSLLPRAGQVRAAHGDRRTGAAIGGLLGGVFGWAAFGNLAELVVDGLPTEVAAHAAAHVRRPFEVIRACRVLCSLDSGEAQAVVEHPDIQAVFAANSFVSLLKTPGMLRRFGEAADGDLTALGALAVDPTVKAAMGDVGFLHLVREVDVVALAAEVERRRASRATADDATPVAVRLPTVYDEPEFREQLVAEWLAGRESPAPHRRGATSSAEEVAAYWSAVGTALEVLDRPPTAAGWLPRLANPFAPTIPPTPETPNDPQEDTP